MEKSIKRYNPKFSHVQTIRTIFILFFLLDEIIFWYTYQNQIIFAFQLKAAFFTNWSHQITLIYFIIMRFLKIDKEKTKKCSSLLHICGSSQIITTLIYWTLLHKKFIKLYTDPANIYLMYSKHLSPLFFLIIECFINNIVIDARKTSKYVVFWGLSYLVFLGIIETYFGFQVYGEYNFNSPYFIIFLFITAFIYLSSCYLFKQIQVLKYCKTNK